MPSDDLRLRELDARLTMPARARRDLIREVRDDLHDLVDVMVARGMPREAALERALALLHPGEGAAAELSALHRSPHARLAERVGAGVAGAAERVAVLALALLAATAPLPALLGVADLPTWAAFPLLALAGTLVAILVREGIRWWVHRDPDVHRLAPAAALLAGGALLAVAWGAFATATEAWIAVRSWPSGAPSVPQMAGAVARLFHLAALSLGVAILGLFGSAALLQGLGSAQDLEAELARLLRLPEPSQPRTPPRR